MNVFEIEPSSISNFVVMFYIYFSNKLNFNFPVETTTSFFIIRKFSPDSLRVFQGHNGYMTIKYDYKAVASIIEPLGEYQKEVRFE